MPDNSVSLTVLGPSAMENDWIHHGRGMAFLKGTGGLGALAVLAVFAAVVPRSMPWQASIALLIMAGCSIALAMVLLWQSLKHLRAARRVAGVTTRARELLNGDHLEVHYSTGRIRVISMAEVPAEIGIFRTGSPANRQKTELVTTDSDGEPIGLPLSDKPLPRLLNLGTNMAMIGPSMRKADTELSALIRVLSLNPHPSTKATIAHLEALMATQANWRGWTRGGRSPGQWFSDRLSR